MAVVVAMAMTFEEVFITAVQATYSNKLPLAQLATHCSVLRENDRHALYK